MSQRPETCRVGEHPWREWPPERRTLTGILDSVVADRAEDRLLDTPETGFTAGQVRDRADAVSALLAGHGVGFGDRVAVMCANRIEMIDLLFGCARLGAVFVPINPAVRGEALRHQITLAEPALVVADDSTLDAILPLVRDGVPVLHVDTPGIDGPRPAEPQGATGVRPYRLPSVADAPPPAPVGQHTLLALLWTSGTTGPSKAVMIPHGQVFWWGVLAAEQMELRSDDVLYTCLPLFHTNGLTTVVQAMTCGGRAVLGPKFSVSRWWSRLADAGATVTYVLGAMSTMLWNRRPDRDHLPPHRVRRVLGGGMAPALKPEFEHHFGVQVLEGFGMTEVGVPMYTPVDRPGMPGMGVPHPDYEARVVDEHGEDVPSGTAGELVLRPRRPALLSAGYWRNEAATLEAWRDLWFHTGDLVTRDAEGIFRFVGRRSDSIRRRGENISSYEVESAFTLLPEVRECAAYAVPSELGEDEVMLCVVPSSGAPVDPEGLVRAVDGKLAAFAVPRYVRFVDELPLTANGKVRKQVLREQGRTIDTWDREARG